jgi:hypothetical protein
VNGTATKFHRIPNSSESLEQDILVQFIHKALKKLNLASLMVDMIDKKRCFLIFEMGCGLLKNIAAFTTKCNLVTSLYHFVHF